MKRRFLVSLFSLLSVAAAMAREGTAAEREDPFKNPGAPWVTTGRGIACPASRQMVEVDAALAAGDMDRFHALAAGCIAPEAGFEIRIVDLATGGPSALLLVNGTDTTGPWYAGRVFFAPGKVPKSP